MGLTEDAVLLCAAVERDVDEFSDLQGYDDLALAIVDAIFSINLDYARTVARICERCRVAFHGCGVRGARDLIAYIDNVDPSLSGVRPFTANMTPGRNAIRKVDAVRRVAAILGAHGIDSCEDMAAAAHDPAVRYDFHTVPGQTDVAFWYLLMLSGHSDFVKPDRRLWGYVNGAGIYPRTSFDLLTLMRETAGLLECTTRKLDHSLWSV